MAVKFEEQCRLSAGVCVKLINGNEVGVRLPLFNYSQKELVGIARGEELIQKEINRVKNLQTTTKRGGWVTTQVDDEPDVFYNGDSVAVMKGVGKKMTEKLYENDILTLKEMKALKDDEIDKIVKDTKTKGLTKAKFFKWRGIAKDAKPGNRKKATTVDFRQSDNPYLARYGEEKWEEEIWKVSGLSKYASVKQLVIHIDTCTKETYKDTPFAETYQWYHDALSQLTDPKCVKWMKEQGYYDRWIKPELGCNASVLAENKKGLFTSNTRYACRPVGNTPEGNPLDNSCFHDTRVSLGLNVCCHIAPCQTMIAESLVWQHPIKSILP